MPYAESVLLGVLTPFAQTSLLPVMFAAATAGEEGGEDCNVLKVETWSLVDAAVCDDLETVPESSESKGLFDDASSPAIASTVNWNLSKGTREIVSRFEQCSLCIEMLIFLRRQSVEQAKDTRKGSSVRVPAKAGSC